MTRVTERELAIPALQAARAAGGTITTSNLITQLEQYFQPSGQDAQILTDRNDTYFSQKVRNLISHRGSSTSMFARDYATYDAGSESITIPAQGTNFLDQVPTE